MVKHSLPKRLWCLTALAVLIQLLVVQAMAASGAFHKCVHDHAGDHGHDCVVTLMLEGGYDSVSPDIIPSNTKAEPLPEPTVAAVSADSIPGHLVGGVLAHAPPRGP